MSKLNEKIKELLMNDGELLKQTVNELNSWDGSFENLQFYENDEDFFETYFQGKPMEAVRATHYGDYRYNDDYVKFNGYGNLESMDDYKVIEEMQDQIDEIIEAYIDKQSHLNVNEIDGIIEDFEEEEQIH